MILAGRRHRSRTLAGLLSIREADGAHEVIVDVTIPLVARASPDDISQACEATAMRDELRAVKC